MRLGVTWLSLPFLLVLACDPSPAASPPSDLAGDAGLDGSHATTSDASSADSGTSGTADSGNTGTVDSGPDSSVAQGAGLEALLDETTYESLFPEHAALFSYAAFKAAAAYYPDFLTEGTPDERKRELAAFLANIAHETTGGWDTAPGGRFAWGLYFTQEVGCESGACTQYCDGSNATYPCAQGKTYHGRGPIQLSWNYNYGPMGATLGVDLLSNPDLLIQDGVLAFRSAIWFWMTAQSPKPSCHDVMTGQFTPSQADVTAHRQPGFGLTIDIINGGIECGYARSASVTDRLGFYARFTSILGVSQGSNLDCDTMAPY